MKNFRFLLAFIYMAFSFSAMPMADCGQENAISAHACCCGPSGSCDMDMPMDCCIDDGDELPAPAQIPAPSFSLHTPLVTSEVDIRNLDLSEISNTKSQISNLKPTSVRVKSFIANHQLVFYA